MPIGPSEVHSPGPRAWRTRLRRRSENDPIHTRSTAPAERIAATGLRVYRSRAGDLIFGVNWSQGRAYYWSD